MKYIRLHWIHGPKDKDKVLPVWLISELDDERWETRKVEIFRDGTKGYASHNESTTSTGLGKEPFPPFSEIAEWPDFEFKEISQAEFEAQWDARTRPEN